MSERDSKVTARANGNCELCGASGAKTVREVPPVAEPSADRAVLLCGTCDSKVDGDIGVDSNHWYCLREAVWSEVVAVQVLSWRILGRLSGQDWAEDLRGQMYLDEVTLEWAMDSGAPGGDAAPAPTLDSNGTALVDGDTVFIIKDLDVKGTGFVAKRGTVVKNIHLIGDPDNIEGRVNKTTLVLKTKFLKKVQ